MTNKSNEDQSHDGLPMNGSVLDRFRLNGQVALVTGAGKGIGAAIAIALAEAGADVAVVSRTESDIQAVADRIRSLGRRAVAIPADLNDIPSLAGLVSKVVDVLGRLDIVINNAGGCASLPLLNTSVSDLEQAFRFNVASPFEITRLAVPHMLQQGQGAVVNIGSMAGVWSERGFLSYSLVKASLHQLTKLMAAELAPKIRVNAVIPGAIETDGLSMFLAAMPEIRTRMYASTPMRRNGTPEDIAAAVLYFASPASGWASGKLLEVDGSAPANLWPTEAADL
jgi:7-alpha-hydroxysteroid dehydrogenase